MSEQTNTPSLSEYYRRFWQRFRREVRKAWWETMLAIIAVIVVLFFQFYLGWTKKGETLSSALVNISPYIVILIAYTVRNIVRTPWLLDTERQNEVDGLAGQLVALDKKLDNLSSEMSRPKFRLKAPVVTPLNESDKDERYYFIFPLENIGSREASDVAGRIILLEEGTAKEPKVIETTVANEITMNDFLTLRLQMECSQGEPPMQIVIAVRFRDAVAKKIYPQTFFLKWEGIKRGNISEALPLTVQEREQLMERVGPIVDEFHQMPVGFSQKDGSIPSSKID